jgi:hypothetical protein
MPGHTPSAPATRAALSLPRVCAAIFTVIGTHISVIAELVFEVILQVFFGMAPERPIWLRRVVQALWVLLGVLVLVVAGLGFVYLVHAL